MNEFNAMGVNPKVEADLEDEPLTIEDLADEMVRAMNDLEAQGCVFNLKFIGAGPVFLKRKQNGKWGAFVERPEP